MTTVAKSDVDAARTHALANTFRVEVRTAPEVFNVEVAAPDLVGFVDSLAVLLAKTREAAYAQGWTDGATAQRSSDLARIRYNFTRNGHEVDEYVRQFDYERPEAAK